ncbi:MAG: formate dehydrogenase [Phreatobacter sp.]|uniref:formate dehydrogenase n=1 Tax=Phreatobacter sp. TaxID=1966341 RepID=UPI002732644C|nr:formate dehydrogenase [Phreatobacter sp.]MDP2802834.1 formate dehydrogenase [Phreatobacter sp.]
MSGSAKNQGNAAAPARRAFLKAMTGASVVTAAAIVGAEPAEAQTATRESRNERTKARYQANSADVQAFYRTNRY